jgi:hypothetical protein
MRDSTARSSARSAANELRAMLGLGLRADPKSNSS